MGRDSGRWGWGVEQDRRHRSMASAIDDGPVRGELPRGIVQERIASADSSVRLRLSR